MTIDAQKTTRVQNPPERYTPAQKPPAPPRPDRVTTSTPEREEDEPAMLAALKQNYSSPLENAIQATEGTAEMGEKPAHLAHALGAMTRGDKSGLWARPYLENIARQAYEREYGEGEMSPSYLDSWVDAWSGGDQDIPLARELNAQLGEHGVRSPQQGGVYDWHQAYGPDKLAPPQLGPNDCGVTASLALMRAVGLDGDQAAMFRDAQARGAHNGSEWAGPGSMPGYLKSFGVNAHTEPMNWQRIDQELAAGRPVVVSTRAHYFVISGKDERGYNMGSTGEKVGGGTHWSQADLNRYSSQHTMVVLDPEQQPPDQPRPPAFRVAPPRATNPRELWSGEEPSSTGSLPGPSLTGSRSEPSPTGGRPDPSQAWQSAGQQVGNGNANHTVQAGDTLWDIARRNGTTYQDIARLNGIANPDLIFPGQQLRLPGGANSDQSFPRQNLQPSAAQKTLAAGGMSGDPAQIARLTEEAAQRYGIPPDILKSIFYAESTWNPGAVGDGGHSYGIGQVYSKAHPGFDRQRASQDLAYQIDYSARLLADLYARSGNWRSAVRSYNGSGPAAERYADKVLGTIMPARPWTQWGVS